MKSLKLKWKRGNTDNQSIIAVYGGLKAIYIAQGKVKIGGSPVSYHAVAVNPLDRVRGEGPWKVTIQIDHGDRVSHTGKTFKEIKDITLEDIKSILAFMEKESLERLDLISQIEAIYKKHDQKVRGKGHNEHTTDELKKHLAKLQAGKFPWKLPAREVRREGPSKDSPAAGRVVRIPVAESTRDLVLREVKAALERRVQEKGDGAFVSIHEIRGALDEEWDELTDAMHSKDLGRIEAELMDWIVGGVFGLACIRAGLLKQKHLQVRR